MGFGWSFLISAATVTSAGPVSVSSARVSTDADLRRYFREIWPHFAGEDKHWPLFARLRFSADAYQAPFTRELSRYDVRDSVAGFTVPTLLVVGSRDPYLAPMQWLADHMPNAMLCVLEEVGHFPFVEAAEPFTETVAAFLNGGLRGPAFLDKTSW